MIICHKGRHESGLAEYTKRSLYCRTAESTRDVVGARPRETVPLETESLLLGEGVARVVESTRVALVKSWRGAILGVQFLESLAETDLRALGPLLDD